uniref:Putative secreted protein n=1 Tax=Anopheles darlingi TaxID=43151 RepID=A0A2M4D1P7_ANODA
MLLLLLLLRLLMLLLLVLLLLFGVLPCLFVFIHHHHHHHHHHSSSSFPFDVPSIDPCCHSDVFSCAAPPPAQRDLPFPRQPAPNRAQPSLLFWPLSSFLLLFLLQPRQDLCPVPHQVSVVWHPSFAAPNISADIRFALWRFPKTRHLPVATTKHHQHSRPSQ